MRNLQEYARATSPEEAVELKQRHGETAVYLGGGTDLLVHRPERIRVAIDIRHAGMGEIEMDAEGARIGGAALLRDVERALPKVAGGMLRWAVRETAPWLIRNAATLAGNIANASPAADSVPALMALDATLQFMGNGETWSPVEDVVVGPHRTTLGDRLIRWILIPPDAVERIGVFFKHSRSKSDIAQVNLAMAARRDNGRLHDVRIVVGASAPTALRIRKAEELVEGREPDAALAKELGEAVTDSVRPIDDWRASAEYRRRVSGVLARRALSHLAQGEREEGSA